MSAKAARDIVGTKVTAPGDPQQQRERLARHPPEGRAQPHAIGEQRQRLGRHDDEGGERNRDDVGGRTVKPGAMEMEDRDRCQRCLDDEAGQQQGSQLAQQAAGPGPLALLEGAAGPAQLMQGNDREDRGEAQLKARPRDRFGPEHHADQRARRDQPQRHRLAP
jgi:hypothetical protein